MTTIDVVAAGHICLDIIPDLSGSAQEDFYRLLQPGRLLEVGPASFSTGGSVSNTGLTLHKLGVSTRLMGKIGDDLFGGAIRQFVQRFGPNLADGMVVDGDAASSYTVVLNPPNVDRIFLHCPGANDAFYAADVRYDVVARSRLFHFGYPPLLKAMYENGGAELAEMFERAKATGVSTTLDLSLPDPTSASGKAPWRAILQATLPNVDIFLPSIEEILFMLRRPLYDDLREQANGADILPFVTPDLLADVSGELLELGVKIVGIKMGSRGMYLQTAAAAALASMGRAQPSRLAVWAGKKLWAPAFQVDLVGTTGAGDATIAGFLAALLRDMSPQESLVMATAVGACNVEAADGLSGVRSWDEVAGRVQAGWSRQELALEAPSWRFDDKHQLWVGP
jgi:sugar/nucleoside kinase (ribokinase family)